MNRPEEIDEAFACLRQHDAPIDEVHGARVWASIEKKMHARSSWRWPRFAVAAATLSLLCGGLFARQLVHRTERASGDGATATKARAVAQFPADPGLLLAPYLVSGTASSQLLDGRYARVDVPPGGLLRATVGEQTRVTLLGPAELAVVSATREAVVLSLQHGVLLCDFQHRGVTRLRVRSPGAETIVVGTLFSVEVAGARSIVSVARGRVEVVRDGGTVALDQGRSLLPGRNDGEPLSGRAAERLLEHEQAVVPSEGATGVLSVVAEAASEPVWIGGRLLGTPPLSACLPSGKVVLLVGSGESDTSKNARVHRIETLVLPYETAVALVGSRPENGAGPSGRAGARPPPIEVSTPPHELAPAPAPSKTLGANEPGPNVDEVGPAELYVRAEAAMKRGDQALGKRTLQELVDRFPDGEMASAARYEIARMAFAANDLAGARHALAGLPAADLTPALREPAHYLRCRVEAARGDRAGAAACLAEFRRSFPSSPHDAEALALLASYRFDEGCTAALPILEEYLLRYPDGPFAEQATKRKQHCRP